MTDTSHQKPPASLIRRAAEAMLALSMFGMVCAVFLNVVLRYLFNSGLAGYEEIARLLFVWLVCVGSILASADREHLVFDLLVRRLPHSAQIICLWTGRVLILGILGLIISGAWEQVMVGIHSRSPVLGYPLGLAAGAILLMAGCMLLLLLRESWQSLRGTEQEAVNASSAPDSSATDSARH